MESKFIDRALKLSPVAKDFAGRGQLLIYEEPEPEHMRYPAVDEFADFDEFERYMKHVLDDPNSGEKKRKTTQDMS